MRHRIVFSLTLLALFLTMAPTALASSKWYVDGVHGNDKNSCKSAQTACKTIGHPISLASSGDSIMVAAATYTENLTISKSLTIIGSGAMTTVIDGGGHGTVVTISSTRVALSKLTIQHGGGGILNAGTLTISYSTISNNTGFLFGFGAGIFNRGTLTINSSFIAQNEVAGGVHPRPLLPRFRRRHLQCRYGDHQQQHHQRE